MWNTFKHNAKNVLVTGGIVGAAGAVFTLGGYAIVYGGSASGMFALGHLTPSLAVLETGIAVAAGAAMAGWNRFAAMSAS